MSKRLYKAVFSLVYGATGKSAFQNGKAALLKILFYTGMKVSSQLLDCCMHDTRLTRVSQKPFKTIDVCDSCFKEHINVQLNIDGKTLSATYM